MSKQNQFLKSQSLTPAVFYILLALSIKELHGYEIMKKVQENSQGKIKLGPGTLYGAIKRLLEEELILEVKEKSSQEERRRYYLITEKGRQVLGTELKRFSQALSLAKKWKIFPSLNPTSLRLAI